MTSPWPVLQHQAEVPRDGIEPPTRGFSIVGGEASAVRIQRKTRAIGPFAPTTAAPVPQRVIKIVVPRTVGRHRGSDRAHPE